MARSKKKPGPPPRPQKIAAILFAPAVLRVFVLGAVAVVACVYAILRAYTHPRPSMLVPAPAVRHETDADAAPAPLELPAPELVPLHD